VAGTLRLASTSNVIVASQIRIADTNLGVGDNAASASLFLGPGTNELRANTINVGFRKGTGNVTFQTGSGSVVITGQAGSGSVANMTLGDASAGTGGGTSLLQLAGHMATVEADLVHLGRMTGGTGGNPGGRVTFDTGTFDANSFRFATQTR
jgi:hypothetical protein